MKPDKLNVNETLNKVNIVILMSEAVELLFQGSMSEFMVDLKNGHGHECCIEFAE